MASLSAGKALSLAAHGEGLLYAAFGIVTNDGRNVGQVLTNSPELLGTSIKGIGAEYKQAARAARNVLLALEILEEALNTCPAGPGLTPQADPNPRKAKNFTPLAGQVSAPVPPIRKFEDTPVTALAVFEPISAPGKAKGALKHVVASKRQIPEAMRPLWAALGEAVESSLLINLFLAYSVLARILLVYLPRYLIIGTLMVGLILVSTMISSPGFAARCLWELIKAVPAVAAYFSQHFASELGAALFGGPCPEYCTYNKQRAEKSVGGEGWAGPPQPDFTYSEVPPVTNQHPTIQTPDAATNWGPILLVAIVLSRFNVPAQAAPAA